VKKQPISKASNRSMRKWTACFVLAMLGLCGWIGTYLQAEANHRRFPEVSIENVETVSICVHCSEFQRKYGQKQFIISGEQFSGLRKHFDPVEITLPGSLGAMPLMELTLTKFDGRTTVISIYSTRLWHVKGVR
jgi:hypothetical protein